MHNNELDIRRRQFSPYIQHHKTTEHSREPDFLHSAISVPASSHCLPLFPLWLLPLTLFSPLLAKKTNLSTFWCYHTNYSTNKQNGVSGLREISGWGWVCCFCACFFIHSDLREGGSLGGEWNLTRKAPDICSDIHTWYWTPWRNQSPARWQPFAHQPFAGISCCINTKRANRWAGLAN